MIQGNQVVEETTILEEIQQNGTEEQEVRRELEKKDGQLWKDDGIVYVDGQIYMPNSQKIKEKILHENHELVDIMNDRTYQEKLLVARNKK